MTDITKVENLRIVAELADGTTHVFTIEEPDFVAIDIIDGINSVLRVPIAVAAPRAAQALNFIVTGGRTSVQQLARQMATDDQSETC